MEAWAEIEFVAVERVFVAIGLVLAEEVVADWGGVSP